MPWEIPITVEDTTYPVRFNTEVEPTQADIDEAVAMIMQQRSTPAAPAADQPGRLGSFASNVGRGALSVIPGTVGGVGYALGSDTLTGAADTIEGGINRMLPVNPEYQDELLMKGGQAVGQAIGMLGTGGAVGAAGKSLALSRGLAQGAAAAKGANLAKNVMLGTGIAQGTRGGGQAAEQYGMQGGAAYARALLGGAIEGASERYLFGMGTELAPVKKFLGEAAEKGVGGIVKSAGTEAGEEAVSQIGGNVATSVLAPYGVQTPGVLEGVGESALLGGIAGGTIGGINALMQPSPTIEGDALFPPEQAPPPVEEPEDDYGVAAFQQQMTEIAAQPDPIAPIQQTINQAAVTSVKAKADLLPATAAVIEAGGLATTPVQEETPVGAPIVEQPASGVLLPQDTSDSLPIANETSLKEHESKFLTADGRRFVPGGFERYSSTPYGREATTGLPVYAGDKKYRPTDIAYFEDGVIHKNVMVSGAEYSVMIAKDGGIHFAPRAGLGVGEKAEGGAFATMNALGPHLRELIDLKLRSNPSQVFSIQPNSIKKFPLFLRYAKNAGFKVDGNSFTVPSSPQPAPAPQPTREEQTFEPVVEPPPTLDQLRDRLRTSLAPKPATPEQETPLEQPEPEPPVVEETTPPEQPIPAVEEAPAPKITSEEVPNVEDVIDEPGAAEVGSGMEKTPVTQIKNAPKRINLSGAEFDVVAINEDGTLRVRNDEGGEFDTSEGESWTEVAPPSKTSASDITKMSRAEFIKKEIDAAVFAKKLAIQEAEQAIRSKWTPKKPLPVGVSKVTAFLTKTRYTPDEKKLLHAYNFAQRMRGAEAIRDISETKGAVWDELSRKQNEAPAPTPIVQRDVTKPEQMTPEVGSVEAKQQVKDRRDSIPAEDLADYDEFMSLLERRGPAQSKVKGFSFTKTDEKRFQELGKKLRKYLFETVSPATDPVIWKDTSGHDIHMSAKRTFYTVENGRVRTGVAFESERFIKDFNPKPIPAEFVEKANAVDFLPEGYVRQGDLYVFQPSGTVEAVAEEKAPAKLTPLAKKTPEKVEPEYQATLKDNGMVVWQHRKPEEVGGGIYDREYVSLVDAMNDVADKFGRRFANTVEKQLKATGKATNRATNRAKPAPQPKPAAEVETPVAEVPATGKYSVYQAGGRWLIQQSDKRGFGDQIEESQEEAIKESLRQQDMERQNKEFYRKQEEKAAEAQRELEAKEKPLNDYLDTLGLTAMQRGKLKKTLQESEGRRSQKTGKTYFGGREQVTRDMVADGYTPTTKQVPAIKEPTGIQWNRMSEREQREYEKKKAAAGTKTEYRLEIGDGDSIFVVTKAEYDYANWLKSEKPAKEFGSTNTVVTKEAKDKAAKSLRESLGQTNVGLNPATLKYAITVGTYYLEGGVRSFADFSAKMIEEVGAAIEPYLRTIYDAVSRDLEHLAAVKAGDMTKAQRLVDEAAKAAGYSLKVWHGFRTGRTGDSFDPERLLTGEGTAWFGDDRFYFASSEQEASSYAGGQGSVESFFIPEPTLIGFSSIDSNLLETQDGDGVVAGYHHQADVYGDIPERVSDLIKDGKITRKIAEKYAGKPTEYAVKSPNQIKSTDPVTYDDAGNVIPLSQRFNPETPDIRGYGEGNIGVSKETADAAAARMRKNLGQTNVGIDPTILKDAITIGAFHLEAGARSFADFSAKMVEEFGEGVRKYLQPAYEALRKRTDIDTAGMDAEEGVETAPVAEAPTAPAAAPAARVEAETPKAAPTQAAPRPVATPTQEPATVAIANDPVDIQREALGLPPIMRKTQEAYTFPQMWSDAEAAMQANPERGKALVKTLNDNPRNISALEDAILLRERVNRVNALDLAMVEFNQAPKGNNEDQRKALDDAITSLTDLDNALAVAGTEQGRSLNARKMLARQDYTLAKMISTLRAANDGDLSEADLATVTRLQKRLKDVQDQLAEVESGQADRLAEAEKVAFEAGRQAVLKDIEERAKNEAAKVAEMQKRKAEYLAAKKEAAKTPSKWEEIRAAARARNAELRSNLYSDVVLVKAASMAVNDVIIGATYIAEGVTKFADWVSKMRSEDINLTDDEMQQLFKESKAFDAGEDLPASEAPLKVKKAKAPAIDKVKAIAADEEALDSRTVYNLVVEKMKAQVEANPALKKVEMSADDLTNIISEVTEDVQEFFPDITEREIRNLFSGYGIILKPSKDDLAKQIRQLSALGKLQSAIEDAEAKRAPLKSGPQRDKATQAIRLQQKKLARELRMMGRDYEAGEEQLRSPLDAIKARLNNQIDDLAMEINARKKAPRRPSVDYDKDTQELADLRDELKRISDFINAPAGPTFTELVNEEMKKIDARIAELQKTLAEGNFAKKEDELLHTAELDAKRAVRDALNNTLQKKRREAADKLRTQEDIDKEALEVVEEAITELNRKIEAEDYALPQRRTPTQTAQYEARVNEKKRLQQKVRDARANLFGRKGLTDEQRIKQATAAIDKSIERMQKMLTSGNYDVPKRTSKTPETPELAQKRETRDKLRKQLLELRKLKRDALIDPIAKQLKTDKKRIQTRMDKLKKRMETGDFSKPEKRKKATDDELLALQVEEENLKEAWAKMVFERQLASRGPGKRLLDAGQQTLNTARAVLTSFDVSAVLRQGGFIVLGNPLRGFRNLGPMFQAFGSDKFAKEEKFRLERRENFKNGAYQQSKLFLADVNKVDQMTQQEEAFMSRWIKKLPKGAKGLYIGSAIQGSQRAYTVFLNRLRMDTFDAMVANLKKGSEPTPQEMSAVANYINIATGRGDLGKFNQAGTMLNTVFFAPRLVASRFQILAGYPYFTASGRTKALVLREYGKFFAGATLVYVIGALAQGDDDEPIETDPRSSDFLKIRFGDTRVDPLSGLIQATVLVSRLVSGEKKQASGKIVPIRGEKVPYGADDSFDVMGNFVRTKFSPIVGSAVNVVTGKNVVGEPTDIGEETKRMLIPMSFTEMKETLEAQGVPEATALIMLQLFGMGVQTYTPGKK
jgi:hypothetical protein